MNRLKSIIHESLILHYWQNLFNNLFGRHHFIFSQLPLKQDLTFFPFTSPSTSTAALLATGRTTGTGQPSTADGTHLLHPLSPLWWTPDSRKTLVTQIRPKNPSLRRPKDCPFCTFSSALAFCLVSLCRKSELTSANCLKNTSCWFLKRKVAVQTALMFTLSKVFTFQRINDRVWMTRTIVPCITRMYLCFIKKYRTESWFQM